MSHHLLQRLHRLKEQKQEFALKALEAMRREVEQGRAELKAAKDTLHASTASYARKVDALYAPILRTTTDLAGIEDVHSKIAALDLEQERLAESAQDAADHLEHLEEQSKDLSAAYAEAVRTTNKYHQLLNDLAIKAREEGERLEELETEEALASRRETLG